MLLNAAYYFTNVDTQTREKSDNDKRVIKVWIYIYVSSSTNTKHYFVSTLSLSLLRSINYAVVSTKSSHSRSSTLTMMMMKRKARHWKRSKSIIMGEMRISGRRRPTLKCFNSSRFSIDQSHFPYKSQTGNFCYVTNKLVTMYLGVVRKFHHAKILKNG